MNQTAKLDLAPGGRFTFPGTSITVNRMGYGAMQLAGPHVFGPPKDEDAAIAVLREAAASGIDHIDTSDFYGPHVTNRIIRKALHPYNGITLVTKIGFYRDAEGGWLPDPSPDGLYRSVEDNLRNLGVDYIEVANLRIEGPETDIAGPIKTLQRLRAEGLVRHIGLSNATAGQIRKAQDQVPIVCVQNQYNLAHRADDDLIDRLTEQGIAYVPFFPLGGFSPLQSDVLSGVAQEMGATAMQVALAWLLQRAPNILLIPGTSSVEHLRENARAVELRLPQGSVTRLDGIAAAR